MTDSKSMQSAHSTTFSPVAILLAVGLSILSLAQSLAALILATSTWRVAVGDRCAWSIDPAWTSGLAGRACARAEGQVGTKAWAVATGIRLAVTVIFSVRRPCLLPPSPADSDSRRSGSYSCSGSVPGSTTA